MYRLLYEAVLGDRIPPVCHSKLNKIREREVAQIDKVDSIDHPLYLLDRHYSPESILAMGSSTYHNAALEVHKKERESEFIFIHGAL